jgi:hypothetical protein
VLPPGKFADCDAAGRYLACRDSDGEMQVWRLPGDGTPGRSVASAAQS